MRTGTGELSPGLSVTGEGMNMQWVMEEQSLWDGAEPCKCRIKWKLEVLEKSCRNTRGTFEQ